MIWQQVPHTPRLENLNSQTVFSMVPPIPWTQVQPDDPAHAPVDVQCGIGPSIGTADLYASVVVRGRPPTGQVAPLNVSLVIDRSEQIAGGRFRQMLIAAQAFVSQLRDGDRLSVIAFSDGVYGRPADGDRGEHARHGVRQHPEPAARRRRQPRGRLLAGLVEVFGAFSPGRSNQVVLFSDGRPARADHVLRATSLAAIAAEHGVGITTVGFGMEHDELLAAGDGRRLGRQLLLRRQPGRHARSSSSRRPTPSCAAPRARSTSI